MDHRPDRPDAVLRAASSALRHWVDDAVGPAYDAPFLRLDLVLTSREARCGCPSCAGVHLGRVAEIVASLPRP